MAWKSHFQLGGKLSNPCKGFTLGVFWNIKYPDKSTFTKFINKFNPSQCVKLGTDIILNGSTLVHFEMMATPLAWDNR